ncbi:hypothetical protein JTE90_018557 [Oedothorax gibbosus]|uniref:Uncharacterized protein n=1 Tax=Oedothorax gibbosus TaxID=931172 RepID=A0AAV6U3N2_9ARAC|nr:hypothetical protein JTE90_018557 [Oedothorax gibbosus]
MKRNICVVCCSEQRGRTSGMLFTSHHLRIIVELIIPRLDSFGQSPSRHTISELPDTSSRREPNGNSLVCVCDARHKVSFGTNDQSCPNERIEFREGVGEVKVKATQPPLEQYHVLVGKDYASAILGVSSL